MKKIIALVLVLALMVCALALAEEIDLTAYTDAELSALAAAVAAEQKQRGTVEEVEEAVETLQKGSKGDSVKKLQQRLIELNYLSGSADGDFGGKTKSAIELFQSTAGLTVNGIADEKTQNALYASDAPKAKDIRISISRRFPENQTPMWVTFTSSAAKCFR